MHLSDVSTWGITVWKHFSVVGGCACTDWHLASGFFSCFCSERIWFWRDFKDSLWRCSLDSNFFSQAFRNKDSFSKDSLTAFKFLHCCRNCCANSSFLRFVTSWSFVSSKYSQNKLYVGLNFLCWSNLKAASTPKVKQCSCTNESCTTGHETSAFAIR